MGGQALTTVREAMDEPREGPMQDSIEGQAQVLCGFEVHVHGVGTVTPPKEETETEGED